MSLKRTRELWYGNANTYVGVGRMSDNFTLCLLNLQIKSDTEIRSERDGKVIYPCRESNPYNAARNQQLTDNSQKYL